MRESEVKKTLEGSGKTWKEFLGFMENQTVRMYEDGETDYYDDDVQRFCEGKSCFRF